MKKNNDIFGHLSLHVTAQAYILANSLSGFITFRNRFFP